MGMRTCGLINKGSPMEKRFTISEAKNNLPAIVHSVETGPSVKLTRRGRPVAVLLLILVTRNTTDYEGVLNLEIENWHG
jgi:antitoxin (DNA-binding transcriptional repressor) of toxin-antitoxin stability system